MKIKIISVLCVLSMLLSMLIGCSAPQQGGGGNEDGGNDGGSGLTDSVKNRLTLAKELANEVDDVRSLSTVIAGQSTTSPSKPEKRSGSSPSPLSFTELAYTRDEDGFAGASGITSFAWADEIVTKLKNQKNQALEICKCLNTWVKTGDGPYASVYRLNYDSTTDTVLVEYHSYPSDHNSYHRFTVTLDASGKAVIDSYSVSYTETEIRGTTELHYYEDKYYFSFTMTRSEDGTAHEDAMFLDLSNKVQAYLYANSTTYYENGVPVRTEYQDPQVHFEYVDGDYQITAGADGGSLSFADGRAIGSCSTNSLTINLNAFDGWTTVSRDGDWVTLNTSKGSFESRGFTQNNLGTQSGVTYTYWIPYYEGYPTAEIGVNFSSTEAVSTKDKLRGAFAILESEFGLTMDEALKERLINVGDRHGELLEQFHFKNGVYAKDINTVEDYFALLDIMRTYEVSLNQLKSIYDGSGINQSEQIIENSYFEFLSFTLNGKATLDATTGDLSLAGITAAIAPSLLMSEDHTYSLVFAWTAPGAVYEIGSVSVDYDGTEMQFTSDVTLASSAVIRYYGEYQLVAYIAMDVTGSHERISAFFELGATANATFTAEEGVIQTVLTATADGVTLANTRLPESTEPQE